MPSIGSLLHSLENSPLATAIAESAWAFPTIETIHVLAAALTVGTVLVVDLRLLSLASTKQPYQVVSRDVLPWTWAAFGITIVSGSLMFMSQASEYFSNGAFRIKMLLLFLAGINMLVFEVIVARGAGNWKAGAPVPWAGKAAALLSLTLWISIVFFGRRIGFTMNLG